MEHDESAKQEQRGANTYATPISMLSSTKSQPHEAEENGKEDERDLSSAPTKKRKLTATSSHKKMKTKNRAQRVRPQRPSVRKLPGNRGTANESGVAKRRRQLKQQTPSDEEENEGGNEYEYDNVDSHMSSLSDSTVSEAVSEPKSEPKSSTPERRKVQRAKPMRNVTQSSRAVPKRAAARKSQTALRSHYFANSSGDGEDGEDEE